MIDSILPALGLRPTLRIVYVAPLPRAPLTRLHPAFSPFGLPVHLIASPHFDELRRPANLALQVTFNVIYPAAPACSRVDSFAPAHSDIRPSHCATLGAGSELVVLVFEQDPTNFRLPICISASPATLDRYPRGVAGHVAHPISSIPIVDFEET
jgi:hypothetical protein